MADPSFLRSPSTLRFYRNSNAFIFRNSQFDVSQLTIIRRPVPLALTPEQIWILS